MRKRWDFDSTTADARFPRQSALADAGDKVIAFGPFRLDRASGRLLRGDTDVALRSKTFAVLEYLALRPGRLVRKDELLDAVWPDTHVTPSVLTGCIRELRCALHDDARAARFIETAYRRGYRFIAVPGAPGTGTETTPVAATVGRALLLGRDSEIAALARHFAEAVARIARRGRRREPPAPHGGRGKARPRQTH